MSSRRQHRQRSEQRKRAKAAAATVSATKVAEEPKPPPKATPVKTEAGKGAIAQFFEPETQPDATWEWSPEKQEAAVLLAEGELTDNEIAAKAGIHRVNLWRWKKCPPFAERVQSLIKDIGDALRQHALGRKLRRLKGLTDKAERIERVIEERAIEHAGKVAGGGTGLLALEPKMLGSGEKAQLVDVYRADTALLKEYRELTIAAAKEVGDAPESPVVPTVVNNNSVVQINFNGQSLSVDEFDRLPLSEQIRICRSPAQIAG
jgi:hypothetical protein